MLMLAIMGLPMIIIESTGAGAAVPNQFLTSATPMAATTGSKAYFAVDDT